jgi:hypothetical protein
MNLSLSKKKKTICIIGCGMGGGIIALELLKDKFNLVIIDSDRLQGKYKNIGPYKKFNFFNLGRSINKSRSFGFGGSSNLWHGVVTELEKSDLNKIDQIANYKISNNLIKNYPRAYSYFDISFNFIKNIKNKLIYNNLYKIILKSNIFLRKFIFVQRTPLRIREKILDLKKKYPEVNLIENAVAISLKEKKLNKGQVEFVEISIGKKIKKIYADIFIICCGSIETPRLILQSIESKGLDIKNNNIGKNLKDHPFTIIGELKSKNRFYLKYFDVLLSLFYRKFKFRLAFSFKNVDKDGNHCVVFKPKYSSSYIYFKKKLKKIFFYKTKSFKKKYKLSKKNNFFNIFLNLLYLFYEKLNLGSICNSSQVFCYLDQSSNNNSFIKLSKKIVNYRKLPFVKWNINKRDLDEFERVNLCLVDIFKNNKQFVYKPNHYFYKNIITGSHHAGTMRISKDSTIGVVNHNLMIHGLKNTYICDNSIFPFYGNSNPSFALSTFALRLSNYLNMRN